MGQLLSLIEKPWNAWKSWISPKPTTSRSNPLEFSHVVENVLQHLPSTHDLLAARSVNQKWKSIANHVLNGHGCSLNVDHEILNNSMDLGLNLVIRLNDGDSDTLNDLIKVVEANPLHIKSIHYVVDDSDVGLASRVYPLNGPKFWKLVLLAAPTLESLYIAGHFVNQSNNNAATLINVEFPCLKTLRFDNRTDELKLHPSIPIEFMETVRKAPNLEGYGFIAPYQQLQMHGRTSWKKSTVEKMKKLEFCLNDRNAQSMRAAIEPLFVGKSPKFPNLESISVHIQYTYECRENFIQFLRQHGPTLHTLEYNYKFGSWPVFGDDDEPEINGPSIYLPNLKQFSLYCGRYQNIDDGDIGCPDYPIQLGHYELFGSFFHIEYQLKNNFFFTLPNLSILTVDLNVCQALALLELQREALTPPGYEQGWQGKSIPNSENITLEIVVPKTFICFNFDDDRVKAFEGQMFSVIMSNFWEELLPGLHKVKVTFEAEPEPELRDHTLELLAGILDVCIIDTLEIENCWSIDKNWLYNLLWSPPNCLQVLENLKVTAPKLTYDHKDYMERVVAIKSLLELFDHFSNLNHIQIDRILLGYEDRARFPIGETTHLIHDERNQRQRFVKIIVF